MEWLIGILVVVLGLIIFGPSLGSFRNKSKFTSAMDDIYSTGQEKQLSEMKPESLEYKLMASGLNIAPATYRSVNILGAIGVVLLTWGFLPGIPAVAIGILTYYAPNAWLNTKIKGRGREIDNLLPLAMSRISASLSAGRSVPDTLDAVAGTLELENNNPLSPELRLTAAELRTKDREEALMNLARRSPSMSLSNLAYMLEGFLEEGGSKYAEIFSRSIDRVEAVLNARNRTRAKAADSMMTAKMIPILLVIVLASLSKTPSVHESLRSLPVQIALGITIAIMAGDYVLMNSMVQEAA
jgi:pilus assembly protein TadC